jgi:YesN/AraC family two-component response regulator
MSGVELANRLVGKHPDLKVLLMSGHAEEFVFPNHGTHSNHSLLLKPFGKEELLAKVGELLPVKSQISGVGVGIQL